MIGVKFSGWNVLIIAGRLQCCVWRQHSLFYWQRHHSPILPVCCITHWICWLLASSSLLSFLCPVEIVGYGLTSSTKQYRSATTERPSHSHMKHSQKIQRSSTMWFLRYMSGHSDTDRQTRNRNTHHNVLHPSQGRRSNIIYCVIFYVYHCSTLGIGVSKNDADVAHYNFNVH